MKKLLTLIKYITCFLLKKFIFSIELYFTYINKNINSSIVRKIDISNFNVLIYIKGTRNHIFYKLYEIIDDLAIISSLTPEDASCVGFYYGLNYNVMITRKNWDYNFFINKSNSYKYNLLFIDRRKNITFSSCSKNTTQNFYMSPEEIFNSKGILKGFNPIQACYIGILAGSNINSKNR